VLFSAAFSIDRDMWNRLEGLVASAAIGD
jgi:hypothetical protein